MSEWEWDPDTYLAEMADEIPGYEELQEAVTAATLGIRARRVLELGTGTGETALRVRAGQPEAEWVGIDSSEAMLARARERLPDADLRLQRLEEELPAGPFDLVVSALAVHHLTPAEKRDLFARIAAVLRPGGRFVLADVIVPDDSADAVVPIEADYDLPDRLDDQLEWLREAGFEPEVRWRERDLAVIAATRP
jgi:tRNA (cmo5U34)-methyltransferase